MVEVDTFKYAFDKLAENDTFVENLFPSYGFIWIGKKEHQSKRKDIIKY